MAFVDPEEGAEQAEASEPGTAGHLRRTGPSRPAAAWDDDLDGHGQERDGHGEGLAEYAEVDEDLEEGDEPAEYVDERGRRHVRRAAPEGTDEMLENEAPRETGLPDRVEKWRRNSATGAVLTAFAFGLQQAFEPERKEPAIVMQTSGDPPKDLPVEAQLEQLGPRQSSVTVRRWLLGGEGQDARSETEASAPDEVEGQ